MDREDTDCKLDCRQKDVKTLWNCPLLVSQLALPPDRQARPRQDSPAIACSCRDGARRCAFRDAAWSSCAAWFCQPPFRLAAHVVLLNLDRKSTRLNSSHRC